MHGTKLTLYGNVGVLTSILARSALGTRKDSVSWHHATVTATTMSTPKGVEQNSKVIKMKDFSNREKGIRVGFTTLILTLIPCTVPELLHKHVVHRIQWFISHAEFEKSHTVRGHFQRSVELGCVYSSLQALSTVSDSNKNGWVQELIIIIYYWQVLFTLAWSYVYNTFLYVATWLAFGHSCSMGIGKLIIIIREWAK